MKKRNKISPKTDINRLYPKRKRFLMSDEITYYKQGKKIVTKKYLTGKEWFFEGHFPGYPIVPGHMMAEAMVQVCNLFFGVSENEKKGIFYLLGSSKMTFFSSVHPKDTIYITAYPVRMFSFAGIFKAEARVGKKIVAKGEFTAMKKLKR